jgi:hypothetical protein
MSRFGGIFWFALALGAAVTNFMVARTVQGLNDDLATVRKKTVAEQKAIHELTADWTFLNQPELLADLNNRYVHLTAVSPKQVITSLDGIPLRPTPPPAQPQAAAPQIAEATMAPAPVPVAAASPAPARPPAMPIPAAPILAAASPAPSAPVSAPAPVVRQPVPPPLSVIASAHAAEPPVATPPPRPAPAKPAASLNALFAQAAGDR